MSEVKQNKLIWGKARKTTEKKATTQGTMEEEVITMSKATQNVGKYMHGLEMELKQ